MYKLENECRWIYIFTSPCRNFRLKTCWFDQYLWQSMDTLQVDGLCFTNFQKCVIYNLQRFLCYMYYFSISIIIKYIMSMVVHHVV